MASVKNKWFFVIVPILIGATAILLHTHLKKIENSPVMDSLPWALNTTEVKSGTVNQAFPALGKVTSATEVRIVPQISGTILEMGPRAGGFVHKGDLIVHLDTRILEAEADSIKAKLISAQAVATNDHKELLREKKLMTEGGSSASIVDERETRLSSDMANVSALKKQLDSLLVKISYGHIVAPLNGTIAGRFAEPGDAVFPGKAVYTMTATNGGRVYVPVPLKILTQIKPGDQIILSQGSNQIKTTITRINPSLNDLAMGSLEIDLNNRPFNLPDGAPVSVQVLTSIAKGLIVPENSLRPAKEGTQRSLFKYTKKPKPHIKLVNVHVDLCGQLFCVIKGNLQEGDKVVTANGSILLQLHDGDLIQSMQQEELP